MDSIDSMLWAVFYPVVFYFILYFVTKAFLYFSQGLPTTFFYGRAQPGRLTQTPKYLK